MTGPVKPPAGDEAAARRPPPAAAAPASRVSNLTVSPIRLISEGGPAGVMPLGLGEPTWPMDDRAYGALRELEGVCGYGPQPGLPELRAAIAGYYGTTAGGALDPDDVIVTIGCQEALFSLLNAWVEPGDRVLVPDPGFVAYPALARIAGGEPVPYPLDADDRFRLDAGAVLALLDTPRLKAVIVNHPGNPTSAGAPAEALRAVAEACEERDVLLVSDEVYRDLYFDEPPAGLRDVSAGGAVVSSMSKGWAACGLRIGWITAADRWLAPARVVHGYAATAAARPSQLAARALIEASDEVLPAAREQLVARWQALAEAWEEHIGEPPPRPDGAFYAFVPLPAAGRADPMAFCLRVRDEAGVVFIPGSVFGVAGAGHARISFAAAPEQITEGVRRLATVWSEP